MGRTGIGTPVITLQPSSLLVGLHSGAAMIGWHLARPTLEAAEQSCVQSHHCTPRSYCSPQHLNSFNNLLENLEFFKFKILIINLCFYTRTVREKSKFKKLSSRLQNIKNIIFQGNVNFLPDVSPGQLTHNKYQLKAFTLLSVVTDILVLSRLLERSSLRSLGLPLSHHSCCLQPDKDDQ